MAVTTMARRLAVGATITAQFGGVCRKCGNGYAAGAAITKLGEKAWAHASCPQGAAQPAPAADLAALVAAEVQKRCAKLEEMLEELATRPAAAPAAVGAAPVAGALAVGQIRAAVRAELEGATLQVDESEVRPVVRDELEKAGVIRHEIVVQIGAEEKRTVAGKPHASLPRAVRLAAARKNVLLVGPAGSGKTHLAQQVAEALGLQFAFISCSAGMSEGQLLGRLLPTGEGGRFEYARSEFLRCYEEGGVFLFDEIDAADSNTLLVLNAALANGHVAVPNRPEKPVAKRHPDFVCVAAANTFGTGADRQYVGRNQLDESTLDRFRIGQIEMDYDAEVEAQLCPDRELRERLQEVRAQVRAARVRRVVSMRFLRDACDMKRAGDTDADIDAALFAGWSKDELAKIGR